MATGFGRTGGVSKCFEYFQDIKRCNKTAENPVETCPQFTNDYLECLHGSREFERTLAVKIVAKRAKDNASGDGNHGGHH